MPRSETRDISSSVTESCDEQGAHILRGPRTPKLKPLPLTWQSLDGPAPDTRYLG